MKKYIIIFTVLVVVAIAGLSMWLLQSKQSVKSTGGVTSGRYIAMGDSVAAGVGLYDASDSSACNRTRQSYPNLVSRSLNLRLSHIACTGAASMSGLLLPQVVNGASVPAQLEQLFASKPSQLISLTVGANDIDWTNVIGKCYSETCGDASDNAHITSALQGVTDNMITILDKISHHYPPDAAPFTVITGYYQVFPSSEKRCSSLAGVDTNEITWWRSKEDALNKTINTVVARYHFAHFVPIDFTNHELCTDTPWVQGISDQTPFHPTEDGQKAIATSVVNAYRSE